MQEIGKRLRDDQWEKLPALFYWVNWAILVRPHRTISYFWKRCYGPCALVHHGKNSRSGQCAYPSELQSQCANRLILKEIFVFRGQESRFMV